MVAAGQSDVQGGSLRPPNRGRGLLAPVPPGSDSAGYVVPFHEPLALPDVDHPRGGFRRSHFHRAALQAELPSPTRRLDEQLQAFVPAGLFGQHLNNLPLRRRASDANRAGSHPVLLRRAGLVDHGRHRNRALGLARREGHQTRRHGEREHGQDTPGVVPARAPRLSLRLERRSETHPPRRVRHVDPHAYLTPR